MEVVIAAVIGPIIGVILAGLVGNALTTRWNEVKRKQELDLEASDRFFSIYGEFFSVWKLWNAESRRSNNTGEAAAAEALPTGPIRDELLQRVTSAEGALEALLVRVTSTRRLSPANLDALGAFRQGYQTLQRAIRTGVSLRDLHWDSSGAAPYAAFKGLGSAVAQILMRPDPVPILHRRSQRELSREDACSNLRQVTSNVYGTWRYTDGRVLQVWEGVARKARLMEYQEQTPDDDPPRFIDGAGVDPKRSPHPQGDRITPLNSRDLD